MTGERAGRVCADRGRRRRHESIGQRPAAGVFFGAGKASAGLVRGGSRSDPVGDARRLKPSAPLSSAIAEPVGNRIAAGFSASSRTIATHAVETAEPAEPAVRRSAPQVAARSADEQAAQSLPLGEQLANCLAASGSGLRVGWRQRERGVFGEQLVTDRPPQPLE
jgi:hypothetical protein